MVQSYTSAFAIVAAWLAIAMVWSQAAGDTSFSQILY
jgi:hypothetical protein